MTQTKVEAPFVQNNANFRNLIINGDMSVWQRTASATNCTDGGYNTVDRWHNVFYGTDGVMTSEREALSVGDQATTGMYYCNLLKCTTADTSIAANSIVGVRQTIEAQFCRPMLYGTSAAKDITITFWAKAEGSKTYSLSLWKRDSTTYYWFKDIAVTSSWKKFTYTVTPTAGSTSLMTASGGAIANDNGEGLELTFVLVAGTNYDGTADTWQDSGADAQHFFDGSMDNFLSATSNTLRITGVQLEVGDAATDFEHLPYDVQFQRCQRYLYKNIGNADGANASALGMAYNSSSMQEAYFSFPVEMRTTPTCTFSGLRLYNSSAGNINNGTYTVTSATKYNAQIQAASTSTTLTQHRTYGFRFTGTGDYVQADAEL